MINFKHPLSYRLRRRLRMMIIKVYQKIRIWKYSLFSDIYYCSSQGHFNQPVLLTGLGRIKLGRCNLGVWPSPYYLNGYMHIEAREKTAQISIEDGVWINNNAVIISERCRIRIGANTLIGTEFTVYDSDFHDLHFENRKSGNHKCLPVDIGENVFIGSRVMILKGVDIGDNSVIASGSIVTNSLPANCIAGGVPARVFGGVNCI